MNDTLKVIEKRFSCRSFADKAVSNENLQAIAEAAVQAPSGVNRQLWQIIVVKNKTVLAEMEAEGLRMMSEYPDKSMYERIMSRGGRLFYNAPCIVLIAVKEAQPKGAELIDMGIAAQNVVLAATSLGIGNCHCGLIGFCFAGSKADAFKKKLKFAEGYECGTAVLLGYAKEVSKPHAMDKTKITFID